MRMIPLAAAGSALLLAMAAQAQTPSGQAAQEPPPAAAPQKPAAGPSIQSVDVVDISELPETTQSQVNQLVSRRGEAEMQKLRAAIDGAPAIKSALEAKGLSPAHVLIAQMNPDGRLTLVTRKAG